MTSERRAYQRFLLHSPIEITGVADKGLQFAERAYVQDVSDLGCRFALRNPVERGGILGVEPLGPEGEKLVDDFPRLFVIVWVKPKGDRFLVGARCLLEGELTDICSDERPSDLKIAFK
jgi:hypothetical protein